MKNQVLSIEQMQKLKELGVDTSKASMCYISKYPSCDFDDGDFIVVVSKDFNKRLYNEFGPAFTLQDVVELLPIENIDIRRNCHERWVMSYKDEITFKSEFMIDAAYLMLIWVIENNYLKTK